jgi:hypothetical protein
MQNRESRSTPQCSPIPIHDAYNRNISKLTADDCSGNVLENRQHLLTGVNILCGIPFELGMEGDAPNVLLLKDSPVTLDLPRPSRDPFLIFLHAADYKANECGEDGLVRHHMGTPRLGETVAVYSFRYADGTSHDIPVRRRFNIGEFTHGWGADCFECIPHAKPQAFRSNTDEIVRNGVSGRAWGNSLFNSTGGGSDSSMKHWIFAAENPHTDKDLCSITFRPADGTVFLFGLTGSDLQTNPIRWEASKRMKLVLPEGSELNRFGDFDDLDMDMGCITATFPVTDYNDAAWESGYINKPPVQSRKAVIIEYTAHPQACLYFGKEGASIPVRGLAEKSCNIDGYIVQAAQKPGIPVKIRIIDRSSGLPVPAKLHIHGMDGEYLAPMNRHRFPNPHWFEDYSVDFTNAGHHAAYVDGETIVRLPAGEVYMEVSKGFEIKPIRCRQTIQANTDTITITLDRVLPWRMKGWVTADTHVHFLSPQSALLEGSAEGVNVINLLASQWGELFTNMGDFDGATTVGSRETGGSGEYLVRVGTENRQHILGHISLLGYEGRMILPLTTGGTDESRLGDPVEVSLSDWARQCRMQNGLNILPHFPNPRAEGAASLVMNLIDGVEMTSWGDFFLGISPYSLSDWYRYLNCGYFVPAVGGTDKMSAGMPVGGVRTYALIKDGPFTYENWKAAVRNGRTFVTHGPLLDFHVNGQEMGSTVLLGLEGGTLDVDWQVSSVTIPATRIELVVNGEVREIKLLDPEKTDQCGSWQVRFADSGWAAVRVRGKHPDRQEVIAAHSGVIVVKTGDRPIFSKMDAMTILEQIEGATAYVRNLGSRADEMQYRKLMSGLTAAHRKLHNQMHQQGLFHNHTPVDDHHNN